MSDTNLPVEIWPIENLKPYARNNKKHPPEQINRLKASLTKFGWTQPLVVWKDGTLIMGHGRRLAALELGMTKIPVVVRHDLTEAQADALRLADNRSASTEYDQLLTQEEIQRLGDMGEVDLLVDIFDAKELDFAMADLTAMDTDFFTDDIVEAVEEQKRDNNSKIAEVEETAAPVGDALGFKRVTIAQSRRLRDLMNGIELKTGKQGVEALIHVLSDAQ